nr:unnamed protein product [Callosobruchus analis]
MKLLQTQISKKLSLIHNKSRATCKSIHTFN